MTEPRIVALTGADIEDAIKRKYDKTETPDATDAARYRWLRDALCNVDDDMPVVNAFALFDTAPSPAEFDAACDIGRGAK